MAVKKNIFGQKLRAKRKELGLTLKKIARSSGLSLAHISDMETGRRGPFPISKMAVMARVLGLDLADLKRFAAMDAEECRLSLKCLSGAKLELALSLFSEWPGIDTWKIRRILDLVDSEAASEGFPERLVIEEEHDVR